MDTLNLSKSYDFFKREQVTERIHIIGCGSVGSGVAELLTRFGLTKLTLYDFDMVEPKNLAKEGIVFVQGVNSIHLQQFCNFLHNFKRVKVPMFPNTRQFSSKGTFSPTSKPESAIVFE